MNLKGIIRDSIKYTSSDWTKVILLGVVLLIADEINELTWSGPEADIIGFILIIIGSILGILEAGYIFRVIEKSTKGAKKLPKFDDLVAMFIHGLKEIIVTTIYALIPVFLIILGFVDFIINEGIRSILLIVLGLIIGSILYIIFLAAVLNMAHHNGAIKSAFEFRKIFEKIKKIGLKRLMIVYIGTLIAVGIIGAFISDSLTENVPVIGAIISQVVIAPFVLISTSRILGLIDEP